MHRKGHTKGAGKVRFSASGERIVRATSCLSPFVTGTAIRISHALDENGGIGVNLSCSVDGFRLGIAYIAGLCRTWLADGIIARLSSPFNKQLLSSHNVSFSRDLTAAFIHRFSADVGKPRSCGHFFQSKPYSASRFSYEDLEGLPCFRSRNFSEFKDLLTSYVAAPVVLRCREVIGFAPVRHNYA